jgi:hypothetical protein
VGLKRGAELNPSTQRKDSIRLLLGIIVGTGLGVLVGCYLAGEMIGVLCYFGVGGGFIGWIIAARIMGWTGWLILTGAVCGGMAVLGAGGSGKGALLGVFLGAAGGLLLCLACEAVKWLRSKL